MQEEFVKTLIQELFKIDNVHHEYTDNDSAYVIDSLKKGNILNIKITLIKENKDKIEFENWLKNVDNDLFQEVLEELDEVNDLNSLYNSENYKEVIDKVKSKTREIAKERINKLKSLL